MPTHTYTNSVYTRMPPHLHTHTHTQLNTPMPKHKYTNSVYVQVDFLILQSNFFYLSFDFGEIGLNLKLVKFLGQAKEKVSDQT